MRLAVLTVMVGRVAAAHAESVDVEVTLTPQGQQLAQNFGDSEAQLIAKVKGKIDDYYQLARLGTLMREFVDATSFVNRDLGVDYAIHTGDLVFGAVGNAALSSDSQISGSGHVTAGIAVNLALTAGANLARWGLPRWSVYASGFYESGSLDELTGHLVSGAAHVQFRAIAPEPSHRVLQWIGLDLGSGLELTRWELGKAEPIKTKFSVQGTRPGTTMSLTVLSNGTLSLVADTLTIPLEVSTGVRLGPLALYVGGGADLSIGSSTLGAMLDGEMTISADGTDVGHVTITATADGSPTPLALRALAGLQLDLPYTSLFVQGNATAATTALAVGLRVVL